MSAVEKRVTWCRITLDASAWRFNRYAERAREGMRSNVLAPAALVSSASPDQFN
jgi:hypothetical protein